MANYLAVDLRGLFAPRPDTSVTAWAEQNIFLPSSVTQNAGQYSTAHCAYLREFLEDFRDPAIRESSNCFAAQTYKTTGVWVGLGYRIDQQPANAMAVLPTFGMAQSFSETKWQPIVESSPALLRHKPREADRFKNLEQQFDDCTLYFVGSGSENNLKGRSVEILVLDEIDDIEAKWAKKGKSGVAMLESRVKSYAGSKVIKTGTPTLVAGAIWKAFLDGDRRLFHVTCPCCHGKPFPIEFDPEYTKEWFPDVTAAKVVWDKTARAPDGSWNYEQVRKSAALECPRCKARLGQEKLPAMIAAGRWIATNPNCVSGKISRRLPSIYSPHEACTLGNLAVKFLQSQGTPGGTRNFLNEELALPYQPKASSVTATDITQVIAHSPPYVRGEIPRDNIALLSLTVDVNADAMRWVIRGWFGDGASALVDYGAVISWDGLLEVSNQKYRTPSGMELSPFFCLIDSGWRTKSESGVYDFCLNKSSGRFLPTKGATRSQGLKKTVEEGDQDFKGRNIKLVRYDEPMLKHDLYFRLIKNRDSKWWLPKNTGRDYEAQLTDEYMLTRGGVSVWASKDDNEHLADCEKQQLIIPSLIESIPGIGSNGLRVLAERLRQRTQPVATT